MMLKNNVLCHQISELRSKISLSCIKTNKIIIEKDASESKVIGLSSHTQKLFESLLNELKKNWTLRVHALFKVDAIEEGMNDQHANNRLINLTLREIVRKCEQKAELAKNLVYFASAVVEFDQNYTQNVADSLAFINDKWNSVKRSLEDKVNTLMVLEKGMVSKILSKDRKTVDERDTFLNEIYNIWKLINNDFDESLNNQNISNQILYKNQAISEIVKTLIKKLFLIIFKLYPLTMQLIWKWTFQSENQYTTESQISASLSTSQHINQISLSILWIILQNKLANTQSKQSLKNIEFSKFENPETNFAFSTISKILNTSTLNEITCKLSSIISELHAISDLFNSSISSNSFASSTGVSLKKHEILYDFLFNNSKKLLEVIESPAVASSSDKVTAIIKELPSIFLTSRVGVVEDESNYAKYDIIETLRTN